MSNFGTKTRVDLHTEVAKTTFLLSTGSVAKHKSTLYASRVSFDNTKYNSLKLGGVRTSGSQAQSRLP